MALKQSIPTRSGAVASYWRIAGIQIHDWENVFCIILNGYLDETTRRATNEDGSLKFERLTFGVVRLEPAQLAELFPAGLQGAEWPDKATLYEFLKTLPDYAKAKDA